MKIKKIVDFAVRAGIDADPRPAEEIDKLLEEKKNEYKKLEGVKKEIFDTHTFKSPYSDSRLLWGDAEAEIDQAWVSIDIDTSELLLVKKITEETGKNPVVISHHPLGRAYSNFYEVMDMQADILAGQGVTISMAESITGKRKREVARRVSPVNHFKAQDAARILDIPVMSIHTPADNHVKQYLDELFNKEKPARLKDAVDVLLEVPEYKISAKNGQPPRILTGDKNNSCGKIYVDMTGGTENDPELLEKLVNSGVSTVVGMHMSDKHYEKAKKINLNVIIAGHISSDSIGLNLLLDRLIKEEGKLDIVDFGGFTRVER